MSCFFCEDFETSNDRHPAIPPGDSVNDGFFICPRCGQHRVKINPHFHLWQKETPENYQNWLSEARGGY